MWMQNLSCLIAGSFLISVLIGAGRVCLGRGKQEDRNKQKLHAEERGKLWDSQWKLQQGCQVLRCQAVIPQAAEATSRYHCPHALFLRAMTQLLPPYLPTSRLQVPPTPSHRLWVLNGSFHAWMLQTRPGKNCSISSWWVSVSWRGLKHSWRDEEQGFCVTVTAWKCWCCA